MLVILNPILQAFPDMFQFIQPLVFLNGTLLSQTFPKSVQVLLLAMRFDPDQMSNFISLLRSNQFERLEVQQQLLPSQVDHQPSELLLFQLAILNESFPNLEVPHHFLLYVL